MHCPVCTAGQFASKLCTVHFSSPAWSLIEGQACPVFQATCGHPGKPHRQSSGHHPSKWSSGHPGLAMTWPISGQTRIRFHSLSGPDSAVTLSGSSAHECRKLSLNIKMHSLQCFLLVLYNCSHLCCHIAVHLLQSCLMQFAVLCFLKSASKLVFGPIKTRTAGKISPAIRSPPKILNCERKLLQP